MQFSHTGSNLCDYMQLSVEPQKALNYFFFIYALVLLPKTHFNVENW